MRLNEWNKNKFQWGSFLILFQVIFILVAFFLETVIGMPHALLYITDVITLVLFLLSFDELVKKMRKVADVLSYLSDYLGCIP